MCYLLWINVTHADVQAATKKPNGKNTPVSFLQQSRTHKHTCALSLTLLHGVAKY